MKAAQIENYDVFEDDVITFWGDLIKFRVNDKL